MVLGPDIMTHRGEALGSRSYGSLADTGEGKILSSRLSQPTLFSPGHLFTFPAALVFDPELFCGSCKQRLQSRRDKGSAQRPLGHLYLNPVRKKGKELPPF